MNKTFFLRTHEVMIFGIGIDLVEIKRIEKILTGKNSQAFIRRTFLKSEQKFKTINSRAIEYYAGRFAAKEAFAKALGTGIGKTVSLKDIGIKNTASGQPHFIFSKKLQHKLNLLKIKQTFLSITHTNNSAAAFVVLEL